MVGIWIGHQIVKSRILKEKETIKLYQIAKGNDHRKETSEPRNIKSKMNEVDVMIPYHLFLSVELNVASSSSFRTINVGVFSCDDRDPLGVQRSFRIQRCCKQTDEME